MVGPGNVGWRCREGVEELLIFAFEDAGRCWFVLVPIEDWTPGSLHASEYPRNTKGVLVGERIYDGAAFGHIISPNDPVEHQF